MRSSVSEAKGHLTELVRRAEAGDAVAPTRNDKATVGLVPEQPQLNADARRTVIATTQAAADEKRTTGTGAARSQDFLYGGDGLPK